MLRTTSSRLVGSRYVSYAPSLAALQQHVRQFSASKKQLSSDPQGGDGDGSNSDAPKCEPELQSTTEKVGSEHIAAASKVPLPSTNNSKNVVWPSRVLGPLTKLDRRFLLPGTVGLADEYLTSLAKSTNAPSRPPAAEVSKQFGSTVEYRTYRDINEELVSLSDEDRRARAIEEANEALGADGEAAPRSRLLECVAHDCPRLLRHDFQPLFTNRNLLIEQNVTLVTLTQRTETDMTTWSRIVAQERELLLDTFVATAQSLCTRLRESGYWADFIDPASGQPFYGAARSTDSLFETDERLARLGDFEIDELTCCKVVRHHSFGTHAYVGCLFTNAAHLDPFLHELLTCVNTSTPETQTASQTQQKADETSTP